MTTPTPDFNKSAFTLTPAQLGEWVYQELTKSASSRHEQKLRYDHIRFLMAAGADPAWNNSMRTDGMDSTHKGYTLAMAAAYSLDVEALKILSEYNVSMDGYDSHDMSPLLYALQYGEDPNASKRVTETALFLISTGVDVNSVKNKNKDKMFPIIHAGAAGYAEVVEALIQAGADVNAKSSYGETALAAAVFKQKTEVVKTLLKAGADTNWVSSRTGKTLIELVEAGAAESKDDAVVEILQILQLDFIAKYQQKNSKTPKGPEPKI